MAIFNCLVTKIFFRILAFKQLTPVAIDFHTWEKKILSQWLFSTVWLPTFFKISSFAFNRRNSYRFGTT